MEENSVPLFGDTFDPIEIPQLSTDSLSNQIPKLPEIPKSLGIVQDTSILNNFPKFDFPLFPTVDISKAIESKENPQNLSLAEQIQNGISNLSGNYKGETTQAQALKYNDPMLGFNLNRNNDDVYSDSKSNFWSGTNRFINETKNWTWSGINSIPQVFDAVKTGDFTKVWDNELNREMLAESQAMQYLHPIYKSRNAQDNPYNVFATGNMAENLSNLGMVAGTIISTLAQEAVIAATSAALAIPTGGSSAVVGTGFGVANFFKNAATVYKNINTLSNTFSAVNAAKNAYNLVKGGKSVSDVIKNAATINNALKTSNLILKTSLLSSGEAGFEAANVAYNVRQKLLEENPNADLKQVEATAKAAGNTAYALNQSLLNVTNTITYGRMLSGKMMTKAYDDLPIEILSDIVEGKLTAQVKNGIIKEYAKKQAKEIGGNIISEGAEEGFQFAIENSVDEYYKDKFNNVAESIFPYIAKGIQSMGTDEGLANIAGGAFIGGGMATGGLFEFKDNFKPGLTYSSYKKQTEDYIEAFNNTNNLFPIVAESLKPIDLQGKDLFEIKNDYDDFVHKVALNGIKQGNLEAKIQGYEDMKKASVEDFRQFSGVDVKDANEQADVIDSVINRMNRTADSYKEISQAYGVNPFIGDNFYQEAIRKLSGYSKNPDKMISATLWEAAKDQAIKQLVNLKSNTKRNEDLSKEVLANYGIKDENKDLFEAFLNSPLDTLNKSYSSNKNKLNNKFSEDGFKFLEALQSQVAENKKILDLVPDDLRDNLLEKQQMENTEKFYENVRDKFENNDLKGFYTDFYKYLTGNEDISEKDLNEFIVKTSDIVKLRFGRQFLANNLQKLQTKQGQKELVQRNIDNLMFYTFDARLKKDVEEGRLTSVKSPLDKKEEVVEPALALVEPPTDTTEIEKKETAILAEETRTEEKVEIKNVFTKADYIYKNGVVQNVKELSNNFLKIAKDKQLKVTLKDGSIKDAIFDGLFIKIEGSKTPIGYNALLTGEIIKIEILNIDTVTSINTNSLKEKEPTTTEDPEITAQRVENIFTNLLPLFIQDGKTISYSIDEEGGGVASYKNNKRLIHFLPKNTFNLDSKGNPIRTEEQIDKIILDTLLKLVKEKVSSLTPETYRKFLNDNFVKVENTPLGEKDESYTGVLPKEELSIEDYLLALSGIQSMNLENIENSEIFESLENFITFVGNLPANTNYLQGLLNVIKKEANQADILKNKNKVEDIVNKVEALKDLVVELPKDNANGLYKIKTSWDDSGVEFERVTSSLDTGKKEYDEKFEGLVQSGDTKAIEKYLAETLKEKDKFVLGDSVIEVSENIKGKIKLKDKNGKQVGADISKLVTHKLVRFSQALEDGATKGSYIDRIAKFIFDTTLPYNEILEQVRKDYFDSNSIEEKAFGQIVNFLIEKKKELQEQGFTFITDVVVSNEKIGVAGEIDLLTISSEGVITIFDFKTIGESGHRDITSTQYGISYLDKWKSQLNAYKNLLHNNIKGSISSIKLDIIYMPTITKGSKIIEFKDEPMKTLLVEGKAVKFKPEILSRNYQEEIERRSTSSIVVEEKVEEPIIEKEEVAETPNEIEKTFEFMGMPFTIKGTPENVNERSQQAQEDFFSKINEKYKLDNRILIEDC